MATFRILIADKDLNILICWTPPYVIIIQESYTFKNGPIFGPPCRYKLKLVYILREDVLYCILPWPPGSILMLKLLCNTPSLNCIHMATSEPLCRVLQETQLPQR